MGYTISYAAKDLTPEHIQKGIQYVRDHMDTSLFKIDYLGEDCIVLDMLHEPPTGEPGVESFFFPPYSEFTRPADRVKEYWIKTNRLEPYDSHIKSLLSGLEELLRGKFAASDHQKWSVGEYSLRKELRLRMAFECD